MASWGVFGLMQNMQSFVNGSPPPSSSIPIQYLATPATYMPETGTYLQFKTATEALAGGMTEEEFIWGRDYGGLFAVWQSIADARKQAQFGACLERMIMAEGNMYRFRTVSDKNYAYGISGLVNDGNGMGKFMALVRRLRGLVDDSMYLSYNPRQENNARAKIEIMKYK